MTTTCLSEEFEDGGMTWKGVPLRDCSKQELINMVRDLVDHQRRETAEHTRQREVLCSLRRN
jgi:hypothetical protein